MGGSWHEGATLLGVFALAVMAPGADFACVVRESVVHGKRAGLVAALGVGTAFLVHAGYTILGMGLVISTSLFAFTLIKWLGAAYLVILGVRALLSSGARSVSPPASSGAGQIRSLRRSFVVGFVTNLLNPKAPLFFVSVFTVIVSAETAPSVQAGYGVAIAAISVAWFSAVALLFSSPSVRAGFTRLGPWFDRVTGAIFVGLGVSLALQRTG